jgi:hypothetical protein
MFNQCFLEIKQKMMIANWLKTIAVVPRNAA